MGSNWVEGGYVRVRPVLRDRPLHGRLEPPNRIRAIPVNDAEGAECSDVGAQGSVWLPSQRADGDHSRHETVEREGGTLLDGLDSIARMLGELSTVAASGADGALEHLITAAHRAMKEWHELVERVGYHARACEDAASQERHARQRLRVVLDDLVAQLVPLPPSPAPSPAGAARRPALPATPSGTAPVLGCADGDGGGREPPPELAASLLGSFELRFDGQLLADWHGTKGQAVLRYLVTHRRVPVARDVLIEALWPGISEEAGRRRLHQAVYSLRQTLRQAGAVRRYVVCVNGSYRLDPTLTIWTDVQEFDRLAAAGARTDREGRVEDAIALFAAAEGLYRGDFLDDEPFTEWAIAERHRLRMRYVEIGNRLSERYADRGDHAAAIEICTHVLQRDAWNETSTRRLMRSYAQTGNPSLALHAFKSFEDQLERDLGVEPAPETQVLYRQILAARA